MNRRRLSREEAALWARVAKTVTPLGPPRACSGRGTIAEGEGGGAPAGRASTPPSAAAPQPPPRGKLGEERGPAIRPLDRHGLDAGWEKKLARGLIHPDFTLDLHGYGLDAAHVRLDAGLDQALALGARVVLVVTGRPRPAEAADRGRQRGAIRAKLLDWLAAGPHAARLAAVRAAHRRHGGTGAVYVVLRRPK